MFKVGVTFSETTDWPIPAFVIKPKPTEENQQQETDLEALDQSDPTQSVAHAVGVLINILIDSNIPHNLMFADKGESAYVIP